MSKNSLREKLFALSDEDLATLVLVAEHAICDVDVSRMIADEIDMDVEKLTAFGENTILPISTEAENVLGWHEPANG